MKVKIPHPYTLIFFLIIFIAILTYIVPAGEFDRYKDRDGRDLVKAGSYHEVKKNPQGIKGVLMSLIKGIEDASAVVGFVLVIGGAFGIISSTGAIEGGLNRAVQLLKGKEMFIIPVSVILFSLGGTTFGMCEETIPLFMIFIPLCMAMGYDSMTGFLIVFMGPSAGCAASTLNPFCVGIAQAIAEIPPGTGIKYRLIQFIIYTAITVIFIMWYAHMVKKNPEKSVVYEIDKINRHLFFSKTDSAENSVIFNGKHGLIISVFITGMAVMVWGLLVKKWYIEEVSMVFLAVAILSGIIAGFNQEKMAENFVTGCKDFTYAAVIIGLARGVLIVAKDGKIIDTLLFASANLLADLPKPFFVTLMLLIQNILAFLVPSSSGLASLTIPVLAPLGDLLRIHRDIIVTAYQYGGGITGMISPTTGTLMAGLSIAKIPWNKWAYFILPVFMFYWLVAVIFLIIGLHVYSF